MLARLGDHSITMKDLDAWIEGNRKRVLAEVYYDPARGFGSIEKTWRLARQKNPWITRDDVADFIRKQTIKQDYERKRRLGTFLASAAREQFEVDLIDFSARDAGGPSYGVEETVTRYALVAIDNFSKKIAVVPVERKEADLIIQALDSIIQQLGVPVRFVSAEGSEFSNSKVLTYLQDMGSSLVFLRSYANTAERVIGTLKSMLLPRVQVFRRPWTSFIQDVVKEYNNPVHSTTKMTPNDAAEDKNNAAVRRYITKGKRFRKKIRQGIRPPERGRPRENHGAAQYTEKN